MTSRRFLTLLVPLLLGLAVALVAQAGADSSVANGTVGLFLAVVVVLAMYLS